MFWYHLHGNGLYCAASLLFIADTDEEEEELITQRPKTQKSTFSLLKRAIERRVGLQTAPKYSLGCNEKLREVVGEGRGGGAGGGVR